MYKIIPNREGMAKVGEDGQNRGYLPFSTHEMGDASLLPRLKLPGDETQCGHLGACVRGHIICPLGWDNKVFDLLPIV